MSIRLLQDYIPNEGQSIRVNDILCRGHLNVNEDITAVGNLDVNTLRCEHITFDKIPNANIVQGTSITTEIDASSVANPYNFNIATYGTTLGSGAQALFDLQLPADLLSSYGFGSISQYYYGGVIGSDGIPVITLLNQNSANDKATFLIKNVGNQDLNGSIHFRWSYALGVIAP